MSKVVLNFMWFTISRNGNLEKANFERRDYDGELIYMHNEFGFASEIEAVNALCVFYDGVYESDDYVLVKTYVIRGQK